MSMEFQLQASYMNAMVCPVLTEFKPSTGLLVDINCGKMKRM